MTRIGFMAGLGAVLVVAVLVWVLIPDNETPAPSVSVPSAPAPPAPAPPASAPAEKAATQVPAPASKSKSPETETAEPSAAPPTVTAETPAVVAAPNASSQAPEPQAPEPQAMAPEATAPEATAGEATAPEAVAPKAPALAAAPTTPAPKIVAPKTVAPKTVAPKTVAPKTAAPQIVAPKTAVPQVTPPKAAAPQVAARSPAAPAPAPKPAAPEMPAPPSFDVVRIQPDGDAVIAGRAPPGWEIVVRDGDAIIGRARANARGEWVVLPDRRLPAGSRQLSLSARAPDGRVLESDSVVAILVPERERRTAATPSASASSAAKTSEPPLAVELPRAGAKAGAKAGQAQARVLQGPKPTAEDAPTLAIVLLEYDGEGNIAIAGRASAGALVRVYLGETALGETRADGQGAWRLDPDHRLRPGSFVLGVEEFDAAGAVVARVSATFAHGLPKTGWPEGREILIVRGHTLWWIARRLYGRGAQYTVIFEANRDGIRDPDLIYPGQVFALPRTN